MPGQELLVMPEMDRSKLPVKSISGSRVLALLTTCLVAVPLKHLFSAENVNARSEAPVKTHAICRSDYSQSEKENGVDWDFWLNPEALSGEGPPPLG